MRDTPQDVHKKVLGRKGEKLAAGYLKRRGYKILKRNYRTPFGEADIVAQDGETVVFCEVKARLSDAFGTPRGGGGAAQAEAVCRHRAVFPHARRGERARSVST